MDADVVNMSLTLGQAYTSITDEINGGYNYDDMIFVAAAGNDTVSTVGYPASLSNVIAVAALDDTNALASFSNTGSALDISAPGVGVLSTSMTSGVCSSGYVTSTCDGTSFASPHVAAAAALLRARYPSWSNAVIRNRLQNTAIDLGAVGRDNSFGYGLLNVLSAIGVSVEIAGPTSVASGETGHWSAMVSGGVSPYSYQWYVEGSLSGSGSSFNYTPGGAPIWLKVQVSDSSGMLGKDSLYVEVSACPPPEIIC